MRTLNLNVYSYLKNICVNKTSGVDDISPKILKFKVLWKANIEEFLD
jgi:hypothetical protein